jgi:hypothetical protein
MSSNSTNTGEQGQLLALLAAANTLSPDKINGSSPTSASQTQSNDEQCFDAIASYNDAPSNQFLTHEAKVEMVSLVPMDEPSVRVSNAANSQLYIDKGRKKQKKYMTKMRGLGSC